ncbi:MAG TPA: sugar porter family MFS transporter [Tepidisphaeraceae bacterium]
MAQSLQTSANAMAAPAATFESGMRPVLLATAVTAIGGFLFGYDTAVISGAIGFIQSHFDLSPLQTGWAGASAIVGCIPGAAFAGFLSDRFGRKRVLVLCGVLFALSGIGSAIPRTFGQFIAARFVGGLGIGASSMICPVYIAEIAPRRHRGRLGALFQLGIVLGIFLVFFVNLLIERMGDANWNAHAGWRWMLGSEAIPAMAFLLLLIPIPESPRWLALHGRADESRRLLNGLVGPAAAEQELGAIASASAAGPEQGRFRELLGHGVRRPLLIAVALAAFSQFSGINAIMYYAPEVFKAAGGSLDSAFASAVWVGLVNFVFTFVAIAWVDRAGRKPLLLIGTAVQTLSLLAVGWMFHRHNQGAGVLAGVLVFVAAFAMAMGPIPWILISEIFPSRVRGRAAALGTLVIWLACYLVAQTFPMLQQGIGPALTFCVYAGCSLLSFLFVAAMIPETKGRSLEEIEASWRRQ